MKLARALLCCCLIGSAARAAPAAHTESGEFPLLDLARELEPTRNVAQRFDYTTSELRSAEHALEQAHPPADAECAGSLGASVYANLHFEVAQARSARGDFAGAAQAYRRALACTPRRARVLNNLAGALLDARDFAAAREYVQQALAMNPRSVFLTRMAANLDFVEERWADAVSRYRYAAASEPDRVRAAYSQLMYWLAQMRAGVAKPQFVERRHPESWPKPLLLYLQNQYTESELVTEVRAGDNEYANVSLDERLCEALFYVGEAHWARGRPEVARDYFAAVVNIKMIRFREHSLALAEIAKLQ